VGYALILVLIAIVVIVVLTTLGGQISSAFGSVSESWSWIWLLTALRRLTNVSCDSFVIGGF
jgi:hypothetical protein